MKSSSVVPIEQDEVNMKNNIIQKFVKKMRAAAEVWLTLYDGSNNVGHLFSRNQGTSNTGAEWTLGWKMENHTTVDSR